MISIKCCGKTYEVLGVGVVSFVAVAGAELGRRLDGVGPRVARRSGAADALLAPAALGVLLRRPPVHDAGQFVVVAGQRHQLRFVFEFHPSVLLFVCFFSFWVCVRWCVCFFFGRSRKRRRCAQKLGGKRNAVMADRDCAGSGPFSSNRRREQGKKKRGNETAHKSKPWDPSTAANPATSLCVSSRGTHTLTHTHTHTPDKITHTRHTKIDGETHRRTLREADTARPTRTHSANLASVAMRWRTEPKTRTWRNGSSPRWLFKVVSWTPSLWFERAPFCCGAAAPLDGHAATVASFAAWNVGPASPSRARPFPSLGPRGRYRVYLRFFVVAVPGLLPHRTTRFIDSGSPFKARYRLLKKAILTRWKVDCFFWFIRLYFSNESHFCLLRQSFSLLDSFTEFFFFLHWPNFLFG